MSKTISVLSTKLLRNTTIRRLQPGGIKVTVTPFVRIDSSENISLPVAKKVAAIITSFNAVKALEGIADQLPVFDTVYCIAGRTEVAVKEHLKPAHVIARPYASALLDVIIAAAHNYPLWLFKGNKALLTLPEGLAKAGIPFESIEVYQNTATPHVVKEDFDAILFFSPSAVESFLQHNIIPDNTITFAIGKTTASALKPFAKQVVISEVPSESAVAEAVVNHFNSKT